MNKKIHTLLTALKRPALGGEEKESLRAALIAHTRGEIHLGAKKEPKTSERYYQWSSMMTTWRYHVALASFLIVATSGAGIVSAAEGALPGDILYSIKTGLSEPVVRLVKATSPISKALFETQLLEKRLAEAEKLDTKNALINGPKVVIKDEVVAQKARAEKAAKQLATVRVTEKVIAHTKDQKALVRVAPTQSESKKKAAEVAAPEAVPLSMTAAAAPESTTTEVTAFSTAGVDVPEADTSLLPEKIEIAGTATLVAEELETAEKLNRVYEKHRDILEKLEIKVKESLEESDKKEK